MTTTISASDFLTRLRAGEACTVLDVRTGKERKDLCLEKASWHMPIDELDAEKIKTAMQGKTGPLYVLCKGGRRASLAAEALAKAGFTQAVVVEGGLDACTSCGAAVKRGNALPLEQQVRVAAGVLVVTGCLLGALMAPVFYVLSFLVGAGLIYAGLTGQCGMALLLAKAPWNR